MNKTATQSPVHVAAGPSSEAMKRPSAKKEMPVVSWLKLAASLRLTVVLMALSILLVLFGTLAQVDEGIGTVLHRYFRSLWAWIPWQVFVRFGQVFFGVDQKVQVSGAFPFPGGWLLGGLLLLNLLAAHAVRFRLTWKRSGVLVLHAGLVVMMLSELITGLFAVESRMTIAIGESVGFVDVASESIFGGSAKELALTTAATDPDQEHTVVIPASLLRPGTTISNAQLPVDVEVVEYWPNSDLLNVVSEKPDQTDVFEATNGLRWRIVARAEGSGVDPNGREDAAAVRVTFHKKDTHEAIGTHLLSIWQYPNVTIRRIEFPPQTLDVDGKTYTLSFRPKRVYKNYALKLTDFTHDKYPGTEIPKDFRSTVQIQDPAQHQNREAKIFMNNPLDYDHDTFYQTGYFQNDDGTVLQVVHNPGWLMPYIACFMVALGMLVHFGIHLVGFIRHHVPAEVEPIANGQSNGKAGRKHKSQEPASSAPTGLLGFVPYAVAFLFAVYLCALMIPVGDSGKMHISEAGKIPVQDGGRVKPLDTLANTSLMVISNRSTFVDENKKEHSATEWLLDVMAGSDPGAKDNKASKYKVFRVENLQLLDLLHLPYRPGSYRYSWAEIAPGFEALEKEKDRAVNVDEHKRDVFDNKVLELRKHLELYLSLTLLQTPGFVAGKEENARWKSLSDADEEIRQAAFAGMTEVARQKGLKMAELRNLPVNELMAMLKPELEKARSQAGPEAGALLDILKAYGEGDATKFNEGVAGYLAAVDPVPAYQTGRVATESFFDRIAPFYQCMTLYILAFAVAFVGLLLTAFSEGWSRILIRSAFWLAVYTVVLHTWALGTRMYLQGRPPVTNLYSAAVWISWGCALLGLVLEAVYRKGIGIIAAVVPGALSMLLAHHLAGSGDTLEMMQAVLDTNFWLATHVTIVTFGYVATFVAGVLGLLYVLLGVLTPALDRGMSKVLGQMIYGVLCFATLLSFTGTVLGGLWADYSWGRFWGWDPKENGALIIVLWNALILHARWGGLVKQRGVAVLSIVGIMVTGWSFIGTNQLGVGLHAYGFNNTLATILVWTWFCCLGLIGMGLIPRRRWLSQ
jgi:ABC-type transport system involved in cytochrome c biogenesis permease subunit